MAAAYFFTQFNRVVLFWIAFVLTRIRPPLATLLTKPTEKGGLNFGTIGSSAVLATILIALITYTSIHHHRRLLNTTPTAVPDA